MTRPHFSRRSALSSFPHHVSGGNTSPRRSHLVRRTFIAIVALAGAPFTGGAAAHAQSVSFSDTTYAPSEWTTSVLALPSPSTASAVTLPYPFPSTDSYFRVTHTLGGVPSPAQVASIHLKQSATHHPLTQGPITAIDYAQYVSVLGTDFNTYGVAVTPALSQNGNYYIASLVNGSDTLAGPNSPFPTPWKLDFRSGLTANDFFLVTSAGTVNPSIHPNFGSTGAPITFGMAAKNTHTFSWLSTRVFAFDDFSLTLFTQPSCGAITNLVCSANASAGTIALSWNPVTPATLIDIFRGGGVVPIATLSGSATSFTDFTAGLGTHSYTVVPRCLSNGASASCTVTLSAPGGCPSYTAGSTQHHVVVRDPFGPDTIIVDNNQPWFGGPLPAGTIFGVDINPAIAVIRFSASTSQHTITATAADLPFLTGRNLTLTQCTVTRLGGNLPLDVCVTGRVWTAIGPMLGRNFLFGWGYGSGSIGVAMNAILPGVGTVTTTATAPNSVPRSFSNASVPYLVPAGLSQLKMNVSFAIATIGSAVHLPYSADIFVGDTSEAAVIYAGEQGGGAIDSVNALKASLEANGEHVLVVPSLEYADDPKSLWVCLGTYPDNHVLTWEEGELLYEYVVAGTPVYVEGADVWGYDAPTPFHDVDGVLGDSAASPIADGDDSLHGVNGASFGALALDGFWGEYSQDAVIGNDFTDRLEVSAWDALGANAGVIWRNDGSGGNATPYGVGTIYQTNVGGAVICSSFEFGGFEGNRDLVVARYLEVFAGGWTEPCAGVCGDCNGDGTVGLPDAIALLVWLFAGGAEPVGDLMLGDCDGDGAVGLPDAISLLLYLFGSGESPQCPVGC